MNKSDLYEIMDKFEKSSISAMKLEFEGMKLELDKNANCAVRPVTEYVQAPAAVVNVNKEENENTGKESDDENVIYVRAKVAGTFYAAPSPDSEPYVKVGQQVKQGDVVGLIEAMKMMNDITAPVSGTIKEIIAKNEELVGFDDILISIVGGKDSDV